MKLMENVRQRFMLIMRHLDEKQRRLWCAVEAKQIGRGGLKVVNQATGVNRQTIINGIRELADSQMLVHTKIRRPGAGRPKKEKEYPGLREAIRQRVDPSTRGDPESTMRWTAKSLRNLEADLQESGYNVSPAVIARILKNDLGYSLQANKKTREGSNNPDRNAQFEHIHEKSKAFIRAQQPVISIDTKKKELIGNFKNNGQEYCPKGNPDEVNVYDFVADALVRAVPYGIYDIVRNEGWVNVGISNDTAPFAVESIRRWWNGLGKASYPNATQIMLTADGGGSNGSRVRLFKLELQKLANETGLSISVCHFPPGTSKWNKIEHRLFSFISQNWRGKPLIDLVTIVNLIGNTRTNAGLKICCELDENVYQKGIKVADEELAHVHLKRDEFHGEWNYTIMPQI